MAYSVFIFEANIGILHIRKSITDHLTCSNTKSSLASLR